MTWHLGGWRLLSVSLSICVALTLLVVLLLPQGFITIDDVEQMLILSGHMSGGEPSPFVFFSNALGGVVLSTLFGWVPSVNWYTLALVGTHVLSNSAVTFAVLRTGVSPWHWILVLSVWTLEAQFLVNLQFTHAAIAASCAGLALIVMAAVPESALSGDAGSSEGPRGRKNPKGVGQPRTFSVGMAVAGTALAVVGSLIRLEGFVLSTLLLAPPIAYVTVVRREPRATLAMLVLLLSVGAAAAGDRAVYENDPGWARFRAFWSPMSTVLDGPLIVEFPDRAETSEMLGTALDQVGWTHDQWDLFWRYRFLEDPTVFTVEDVSLLAVSLRTSRRPSEMVEALLLQKAQFAFAVPMLVIALVPFVPGVMTSGRSRYLLLVGGVAIVGLSLIGYLVWTARLPRHVRLPMVYVFAVMAALGASRAVSCLGGWRSLPGAARAALIVSLVTSLGGSAVVLARSASAHRISRITHAEIERRLLPDPSSLYFLANWEYLRTLPPWTNLHAQPRQFLPVAGLMRTPLVYRALAQIGERSLVQALGRNDRLRVVGQQPFLDLLRAHVENRHGSPVRLQILDVVGPPPTAGERDRRIYAARLFATSAG